STADATLPRTRCICCAYGRALIMRSCARRSFDAATIFIAFVICCVFFTARTRRRRSIRDGIRVLRRRGFAGGELRRDLLHRLGQRALQRVVELLLLGYPAQHLRVPRL